MFQPSSHSSLVAESETTPTLACLSRLPISPRIKALALSNENMNRLRKGVGECAEFLEGSFRTEPEEGNGLGQCNSKRVGLQECKLTMSLSIFFPIAMLSQ